MCTRLLAELKGCHDVTNEGDPSAVWAQVNVLGLTIAGHRQECLLTVAELSAMMSYSMLMQ
jgi:hypothetical protein